MAQYWVAIKRVGEDGKVSCSAHETTGDPCKSIELFMLQYGRNNVTVLKEVFPEVTLKVERNKKVTE